MTPDEIKRQVGAYRRHALANFPLTLIETSGDQALATWQELKSSGRGAPVVLGGDDETHPFDNLLTPFGPNGPHFHPPQSVEAILQAAARIGFPGDLEKTKKADSDSALARFKTDLAAQPEMPIAKLVEIKAGKSRIFSREETIAAMEAEPREPPLGEWPETPNPSPGLSVAYDLLKGAALSKVYIGIAPTDDWTTIPAYLRWGGWNNCPSTEYHVAALRQWRDRYGAELVGMSFDTINLQVSKRPASREEALALARDQYVYCEDIIDQGVQSYSALAADLMANDWWFFWWD